MSFRGRGGFRGGGGGFRGRGGGGGNFRGGSRGGGGFRGGGRGGFGGNRDFGPPEEVKELGYYTHPCEDDLVIKCTIEPVPYFNAPIYLENKQQIGKVDEIFGTLRDYYVSVKLSDDVKAKSFETNTKVRNLLKESTSIRQSYCLWQGFFPNPPVPVGEAEGGPGEAEFVVLEVEEEVVVEVSAVEVAFVEEGVEEEDSGEGDEVVAADLNILLFICTISNAVN
ncbi:unnamed protein product [Cyprideis torosa]|uniref:H/ACA ribonucleoprotein complex subunit n=1 Tax=Cyprideis torosa TaxID=163714 RepID=A0A7R8W2K4_9CRUS|nr:unnamed protein product [Cyprideis torosa]CAG0882029.1 unnamed protein product [Cyprideis torosa]